MSRKRHFEITNRALVLLWDSVIKNSLQMCFQYNKEMYVFWHQIVRYEGRLDKIFTSVEIL